MNLEVDLGLIEEAVFQEMRRRESDGDTTLPTAYRRDIDEIYDDAGESGQVDEPVRRLHQRCFGDLGLDRVVADALAEFPLLDERVDVVSVQRAERRKAEGSELFVRRDGPDTTVRSLVLRIYPDSFLDVPRLREFLRRELYHIADMLDPAFGYVPDLGAGGRTAAQDNLLRDRYALLWSVSIEGRLRRPEGTPEARVPARLRRLAQRAFAGMPDDDLERRLSRAWLARTPTHVELVALATSLLAGRGSGESRPGDPCPDCGFPTHTWVDGPAGPACQQCADLRQHDAGVAFGR